MLRGGSILRHCFCTVLTHAFPPWKLGMSRLDAHSTRSFREGKEAGGARRWHVPRPAMPAGGARAVVVPYGLQLAFRGDARRNREHGRAGAPRGMAREDLLDALGAAASPLLALPDVDRVGAHAALDRAAEHGVPPGHPLEQRVEDCVDVLPPPEILHMRRVGGVGEGGDRVVHRLEAKGEQLQRLVLAHGRPMKLLAVAAPGMCQTIAEKVVTSLEVGVGHDNVVAIVRKHERASGAAALQNRCAVQGELGDDGVLLVHIREGVVELGGVGLVPLALDQARKLGGGLDGERLGRASRKRRRSEGRRRRRARARVIRYVHDGLGRAAAASRWRRSEGRRRRRARARWPG